MTKIKAKIEALLIEAFSHTVLEVEDDSVRHQGHREGGTGQETHFNVLIVSDEFYGQSFLQRHRNVYQVLQNLLKGGIHALSLTLLTRDEYEVKLKVSGV